MMVPSLLYGLGTTGSRIVQGIVSIVQAELGRLPNACNYLAIDGAALSMGVDQAHAISIDFSGCGTDATRGRRQFFRYYHLIRNSLNSHFEGLATSDSQVTVLTNPGKAVTSWIFAAAGGGSGGGMLQPMVTLLHDVARQHGVGQHRVHLILVGADIPTRDSSRSVTPEQTLAIADNTATNLIKIFFDITSSATSVDHRPDGTSFRMPAAQRVWAPYLIDQPNGSYHLPTVDDLIAMASWEFFLQIFTAVGKYIEERDIDHERLGLPARGMH
jgi:hypothetical protein